MLDLLPERSIHPASSVRPIRSGMRIRLLFRIFPSVERNSEYREGIYVGYRYYDTAKVQVLYPFGFGLSYNEIYVSEPEDRSKSVEFTIENTGEFDGAEIVQLYIGKEKGRFPAGKRAERFSESVSESRGKKDRKDSF